jgi:hypothetical protein
MSAFRLVRKEPSDGMLVAGVVANQERMVADVFSAMLSVSEPPTDAELRELARLMWGDKPYWSRPDLPKSQPTEALCQEDIARMRKFLEHLS